VGDGIFTKHYKPYTFARETLKSEYVHIDCR
jgi:hypothetical protein